MESSSPFRPANSVAGVKRPAPPTLLPAFEPIPSSPPVHGHRPSKRQARRSPSAEEEEEQQRTQFRYLSPIPTSSLGISSSPPRTSPYRRQTRGRPPLRRTTSSLSERAPLASLPEILVPENGDYILLGRSSNSSHYQLSFNRHISRTHVRVAYIHNGRRPKIEIYCIGANGAKVHCGSQQVDLSQGDTFTSETPGSEIILDVMDARVLIKWPRCARELSTATTSTYPLTDNWENDENVAPTHSSSRLMNRHAFPGKEPVRELSRSPPPSPTPRRGSADSITLFNDPFRSSQTSQPEVQVYEDDPEEELPELAKPQQSLNSSFSSENADPAESSELSELESDDEENEIGKAVSMSFGSGSAVPSMMKLPSKKVKTPKKHREPLQSSSPARNGLSPAKTLAITNHLANQLAFARVASTPLSYLLSNLPRTITGNDTVSREALAALLGSIPCIGVINRMGKDAAGKPLESEFYYIPENDYDEERRRTVMDGLRKPGLRACRKSHKQYFWKKPKKLPN